MNLLSFGEGLLVDAHNLSFRSTSERYWNGNYGLFSLEIVALIMKVSE